MAVKRKIREMWVHKQNTNTLTFPKSSVHLKICWKCTKLFRKLRIYCIRRADTNVLRERGALPITIPLVHNICICMQNELSRKAILSAGLLGCWGCWLGIVICICFLHGFLPMTVHSTYDLAESDQKFYHIPESDVLPLPLTPSPYHRLRFTTRHMRFRSWLRWHTVTANDCTWNNAATASPSNTIRCTIICWKDWNHLNKEYGERR